MSVMEDRSGCDFSILIEFCDSVECHKTKRTALESPLYTMNVYFRLMGGLVMVILSGTDLRIKRIVLQSGIYINRLFAHPPEGSVLSGCRFRRVLFLLCSIFHWIINHE